MAAVENYQNALSAKINEICAKHGVSPDELFSKPRRQPFCSKLWPWCDDFFTNWRLDWRLWWENRSYSQESERTKLNVSKKQAEFNKIVDIAEKTVDLSESHPVIFAKQSDHQDDTCHGSRYVKFSRMSRYSFGNLDIFPNSDTLREIWKFDKERPKIFFEFVQWKLDKGKFSVLDLALSQNFLSTLAIDMHSYVLKPFGLKVMGLQANVAVLKELSEMISYHYYKDCKKKLFGKRNIISA